MTDFWQQLETLFEEEIRAADLAQSDFDKILSARIERAEGRSNLDMMLVNLAERGVLQYQKETHERLGRAVHGLLRNARKSRAKSDK